MSDKARIAEAGERFAADTASHEMTVLHDEGLYRHLRFRRMEEQEDGTRKPVSWYWFDIVTWPGCLTVNGDMECFAFSRVEDMLGFFRGHAPNPSYWSEKLRAPRDVKTYSDEVLRQFVTEHVEDDDEEAWPGLRAAVEDQVLGSHEIWDADSAQAVLADFEFGATLTARCSCGTVREGISLGDDIRWETGHRAMAPAGGGQHRVTWQQVEGFRFRDTWEWDVSDYTHQFLWCCHAIPWAIAQYDKARAAAAA